MRLFIVLLLSLIYNFVHAQYGVNLIQNPAAETSLVSGEIPNWVEVSGTSWNYRSNSPSSQEGTNYFFAGNKTVNMGGTNLAELAQNINVNFARSSIDAGNQSFAFEGYVRSFNQTPTDAARIVLEYKQGGIILDTFDTGELFITTNWFKVSDTRFAPINTDNIQLRLISVLKASVGSNNDGYFDNLNFVAITPIPEPSMWLYILVWMICFGIGFIAGKLRN